VECFPRGTMDEVSSRVRLDRLTVWTMGTQWHEVGFDINLVEITCLGWTVPVSYVAAKVPS